MREPVTRAHGRASRHKAAFAGCGAGLFLLVSLGLFWPGDTWAFRCSRTGPGFGPSLVWTTREIPWHADRALLAFVDDVGVAEDEARRAFETWEDVGCSDMRFPYQGSLDGVGAGYTPFGVNQNVIVLVTSDWKHEEGAIAVTTNIFDARTGVVVDSDIEFNGQHFAFGVATAACFRRSPSTMDFRNVLTHEIGHVVGLDHPPLLARYQNTTMFASAPACETKKRSLAEDDINGLCAIYPAGQETVQCFEPEDLGYALLETDDGYGGCRCASGASGTETIPLVMVCLLLCSGGVRRRIRSVLPIHKMGGG